MFQCLFENLYTTLQHKQYSLLIKYALFVIKNLQIRMLCNLGE